MGNEGRDPRGHGASRAPEDSGDELFDVPPTRVDPHAGRRAAAALAAGRGFGHHEVPTRESKDVAARLAAHERAMARQRETVAPEPIPARRTTPRAFDLRVDALEEVEGPGPLHVAPIEEELLGAGEPSDRFDIPLETAAGIVAPAPRRRGLRLIVGATVAVAILVGVGYLGLERGWLPRSTRVSALLGR